MSTQEAAPKWKTLGELRRAGHRPRTLREELRANLLEQLRKGEPLFPGILGYDDTVVPAVENALLCGHDLIFLGERGQAKTPHDPRSRAAARRVAADRRRQRDPRRPVRAGLGATRGSCVAEQGDDDADRAGCTATTATSRSSPRPTSRSPT